MHGARLPLLAATLIALTASRAGSQTIDVINARRVQDYVYLVHEPLLKDGKNGFTYATDEHAGRDRRKPLTSAMTIAGNSPEGVNIVLRFLNPITSSWSVSESTAEDPTYAAVRQFLKSAEQLFGIVGGKTDGANTQATSIVGTPLGSGVNPTLASTLAIAPDSSELDKATAPRSLSVATFSDISPVLGAKGGTDAAKNKMTSARKSIPVPVLYAPALRDWSQWLVEKSSCINDSAEAKALVKGVSRADAQIYGTDKGAVTGVRSAESFKNGILLVIKTLKDATTIKELETASRASAETVTVLKAANKNARESLGGVKSPEVWGAANGCPNFATHTAASLQAFQAEGDKIIDSREKLLTDLATLNESVSKLLLPSMHTDGDQEYFTIANVEIPHGKMKKEIVVVHQRSVELKDGALQITERGDDKVSLNVLEHQALVFEFAPGLAYVDIAYPKFAPVQDNGKSVVGSAGEDKQIGSVVAMLNVTPNIHWGGMSRLIGQIGVGTGKQFPLLLFGGGIRLTDATSFTLTAGGALSWRSELSTLKPGDPVTGIADIEKDLHYKLMSPRFYIGVQRGLQ